VQGETFPQTDSVTLQTTRGKGIRTREYASVLHKRGVTVEWKVCGRGKSQQGGVGIKQ